MTVTLKLKPETEASLRDRARATGMTLEEYLVSVVEGNVPSKSEALTPEQRAGAFEAWSASHRETPPLPDFAVSRETIYGDRDAG